ncbi:MAG TPA: hypothetical protein VK054_12270, partial [Beutenbergiaceae bacterium]|nr:hypothetical protein [Beutenbergiaceae bacterium]
MAFINKRTTTTGEERYRVGYIENGKQRFTPTLETAEGAAEMKNLIETIGPAAALAILKTRTASAGAKTVADT